MRPVILGAVAITTGRTSALVRQTERRPTQAARSSVGAAFTIERARYQPGCVGLGREVVRLGGDLPGPRSAATTVSL